MGTIIGKLTKEKGGKQIRNAMQVTQQSLRSNCTCIPTCCLYIVLIPAKNSFIWKPSSNISCCTMWWHRHIPWLWFNQVITKNLIIFTSSERRAFRVIIPLHIVWFFIGASQNWFKQSSILRFLTDKYVIFKCYICITQPHLLPLKEIRETSKNSEMKTRQISIFTEF